MTSHFLAAGAFRTAFEALERLRWQDVGLHGYRYHTYATEEENLLNIRRGKELLAQAGLEPIGFAGADGRWNRSLLAALEKLGFHYSSEFGLAYDELPFYPLESEVLQIPIHPIGPQLFLEAAERASQGHPEQKPDLLRSAQDAAVEYFSRLMKICTLTGEPALLHARVSGCLGRYPQLLQGLLAAAEQYGSLWRSTLSEIYRWWQVRSKVQVTVYQTPDGYQVHTHRKPAGFRVAVELWRGGHVAVVPLDRPRRSLQLGALAFEKRPVAPRPRPVRIDPPEGLRERLRRWWDRYRRALSEEMNQES